MPGAVAALAPPAATALSAPAVAKAASNVMILLEMLVIVLPSVTNQTIALST